MTKPHNLDLTDDLKKMGNTAKKIKPKPKAVRRPERPKWLTDGVNRISQRVRANVHAILDVEAEVLGEDGINRSQLGVLMGLKSSIIYSVLNGTRDEIGTSYIVRFCHALGLSEHLILLPPEEFKRIVVPEYRKSRDPKRTKRTAKKAS